MFKTSKTQPQAQQQTILSGMRVQSSVYGQVRPIVYGQQRVAGMLLNYTDFTAIPHTSTTTVGGKGGGGGNRTTTTTTYTYQAAVQMALCEGGVTGINSLGAVWDTKGRVSQLTVTEVYVVPVGGGTFTVSQSAYYSNDNGVTVDESYDTGTYTDYGADYSARQTGTWKKKVSKTTSAPSSGQYTTPTNGQYQFSAADAGKTMTVSYSYYAPTTSTDGSPLTALNVTLFPGQRPATPWSYMATAHPSMSLAYSGLAHVDSSAMDLGNSASLPNLSWEIIGLFPYGAGFTDANPKDIVFDFLTNVNYGCLWPTAWVGDLTSYSNYCVANGLFLSAAISSQASAASILNELLDATNSAAVWSGSTLKIIPYGDSTLAANGVIYTPNTTPIYDLTDDDFIANSDEDPVTFTRTRNIDAHNYVEVEFLDRSNAYNPDIARGIDKAAIETYGERKSGVLKCHFACSKPVAQRIANAKVKRKVNVRNIYTFKTDMRYMLLEPMDLVTLTDTNLGLNKFPVRILTTEDDGEEITFTAEEFPWGTATATLYAAQSAAMFQPQTQADPGSIQQSVIFEATERLSRGSGYEIWIGAASSAADWGGCNIWISADGTNYKQIGSIHGSSRIGTVATTLATGADPDTVNSFDVDLANSNGKLSSGTNSDADNARTLCLVGSELLAYTTATLVSGHRYTLSGYLRRGVFGSPRASHSVGQSFARLDDAMFSFEYDPTWVGKTVSVKFTSFNTFGQVEQSLSEVSPVSFTINGVKPSNDRSSDEIAHFGICSGGGGNYFDYRRISTASYTVAAGDRLEYDIFIDLLSPAISSTIDFVYNSGASQGRGAGLNDQNGLALHGATDLTGYADGRWYHRSFDLSPIAGQTITEWASALEGDAAGTYLTRFANIRVMNGNTLKKALFTNAQIAGSMFNLPVSSAVGGSTGYSSVKTYSTSISSGAVNMDDHVSDGSTYRRPKYVTVSGVLDTSTIFNGQGSILPNQPIVISYTLYSDHIDMSWSSQTLQRADGSSITLTSGSLTYSSLSATTTYYIYPYIRLSDMTLQFTNSAPPTTTPNATNAINAYLDGRVPVQLLKLTTPTSGSSGGTGGGGDTCPDGEEIVTVEGKGEIKAIDVEGGVDRVLGHCFATGQDVFRRVVAKRTKSSRAWRVINGKRISPCEPVYYDGTWTPAFRVPISTFDMNAGIQVALTVEADEYDECNFYVGRKDDNPLLIHNQPIFNC